jgi:hypothetical protein
VKTSYIKSRKNLEKLVDVDWQMRNKEFDCRKMIYVYRKRKIDLDVFWKNNLNSFWSLVKIKQNKNTNASAWMHQQVVKPYDKFQFSEKYYFLCFHEHINSKLTHFSSISKEANFRVLQFYPLKMNLVLEIRKMVVKEIDILCLGILLTFLSSSISLVKIPPYFA